MLLRRDSTTKVPTGRNPPGYGFGISCSTTMQLATMLSIIVCADAISGAGKAPLGYEGIPPQHSKIRRPPVLR